MTERPRRGFLLALSAACLLFGACFSWKAPLGGWNNSVFGAEMWNEGDPGGYYVPSAHELFSSGGKLLYPGHPGLPLQLLLRAVQSLYFTTSAPSSLGFTPFIARKIAFVFFLSKLLMACLHILSFWLLYRFALATLGRERPARLAVLSYATSLPILYYLSRISVEPLVSVFFLSTFLAAWECLDARARNRSLSMAALAGACAVSGLATKFHLLWPLPLIGLLSLRKARRSAVSTYAATAIAAFILYSRLIDWRDFFAYWDVSGMTGAASSGLGGLIDRQLGIFPSIAIGLRHMPLSNWLPARTRSGLFLLCEAPFLAVALYGLVRTAQGNYPPPRRLFFPALAAAYTLLIWLYRAAGVSGDFHDFHYLFIFVLLSSLFFGQASDAILSRASAASGGWKETFLTLLLLAAVHAVPVWAAFDARSRDAGYFSTMRAFPDALAEAPSGSHVEVVGSAPFSVARLLGLAVLRDAPPTRSKLLDELSGLFIFSGKTSSPISSVIEVSKVGGISSAKILGR